MQFELNWKKQGNNAAFVEQYDSITDVVGEFKRAMGGIYANNDGHAIIVADGAHILEWHEHPNGAYCAGQMIADYNPRQDLDECACHDWDDECELCENCERKVLEICLDILIYESWRKR